MDSTESENRVTEQGRRAQVCGACGSFWDRVEHDVARLYGSCRDCARHKRSTEDLRECGAGPRALEARGPAERVWSAHLRNCAENRGQSLGEQSLDLVGVTEKDGCNLSPFAFES